MFMLLKIHQLTQSSGPGSGNPRKFGFKINLLKWLGRYKNENYLFQSTGKMYFFFIDSTHFN